MPTSAEQSSWYTLTSKERQVSAQRGKIAKIHIEAIRKELQSAAEDEATDFFEPLGKDGSGRQIGDVRPIVIPNNDLRSRSYTEGQHSWEGKGLETISLITYPEGIYPGMPFETIRLVSRTTTEGEVYGMFSHTTGIVDGSGIETHRGDITASQRITRFRQQYLKK